MKWIKHGLIFAPSFDNENNFSHTQCPTALDLGDVIRIYFGSRNDKGRGEICYIDVDSKDPKNILHVQKTPVLAAGPIGVFDQDGVLPVCVKKSGDDLFMYYGGFSRMVTIPHTCMMGLAISKDNGRTFSRLSEGPIFPISKVDPYLIGSADVIFHDDLWHMIYTSGTSWEYKENKIEQSYVLKYASSTDGITWDAKGEVVFPRISPLDAYAKPVLFKLGDTFHIYFSKRTTTNYRQKGEGAYSFGYATSTDLINWNRDDANRGIEVSTSGWDSEMICYATIIKSNNRYLMFYNGNGFGATGFGYAELKEI